jgi:hypothetical protein
LTPEFGKAGQADPHTPMKSCKNYGNSAREARWTKFLLGSARNKVEVAIHRTNALTFSSFCFLTSRQMS